MLLCVVTITANNRMQLSFHNTRELMPTRSSWTYPLQSLRDENLHFTAHEMGELLAL